MVEPLAGSSEYYCTLLDSIPIPIMLVDDDVTVLDLNTAATEMMRKAKSEVLRKRGGEAMSCVHSADSPAGCGAGPHCQDCDVRNSVREANFGKAVQRRRAKFEMVTGSVVENRDFLITASPVLMNSKHQVVLIFEDVTELAKLRSLIPMCSHCRRVRIDEEYWQSVEEYLESQHGTSVSHGLCLDCLQAFYPGVSDRILAKRNNGETK